DPAPRPPRPARRAPPHAPRHRLPVSRRLLRGRPGGGALDQRHRAPALTADRPPGGEASPRAPALGGDDGPVRGIAADPLVWVVWRTSRPGGRVGVLRAEAPPRKVRAPQGRVVGNTDPG